MSILLKKSVNDLETKDVKKELLKLDEIAQDIECSICQETYTDPVMVDPCYHLYCHDCIKSWSCKVNEWPKCKETIKSVKRQSDIVPLLNLYKKLVEQEKEKVMKIQTLLEEREQMQQEINSIFDNPKPETIKRPQTAFVKAKKEDVIDIDSEVLPKPMYDDDYINCRIWKRRPLSKQLQDCKNIELSPISLNGNEYAQGLLTSYLLNNNLTLDQIYLSIINSLSNIDIKKIHPDCKSAMLRPSDSACNECLFEFVENWIFYWAVTNRFLIDPSIKEDCGAGAFCYNQYDSNHAQAYNHFMFKY